MDRRAKINRRYRRRKSRAGVFAFITGLLLVLAVPIVVIVIYFNAGLEEAVHAGLPGWLPGVPGATGATDAVEVAAPIVPDAPVPPDSPVDAVPVPPDFPVDAVPVPPDFPVDAVPVAPDAPLAPDTPVSPADLDNMFSFFPFYIPENAAAYEAFRTQRPDLDYEDVVWKVNVGLHLPFYSYIQTDYSEEPLLLSPFVRLPYGFTPAILVRVYEDNPDLLATPATVEAFRQLRASSQRAGLDLSVVSAFRTAERQRVLFERQTRDGIVARPYHSEHQTGRALDLWGPTASGLLDSDGIQSPQGLWVAQNAHNYGFIVRYTAENSHITDFIPEPWHITYVGREISMYMYNNNIISLEEYVGRNPWILNTA